MMALQMMKKPILPQKLVQFYFGGALKLQRTLYRRPLLLCLHPKILCYSHLVRPMSQAVTAVQANSDHRESIFMTGYILADQYAQYTSPDDLSKRIYDTLEVDRLMSTLPIISSDPAFTPKHLVVFTEQLVRAVYAELVHSKPWLQNYIHSAYKQLIWNGDMHLVRDRLSNLPNGALLYQLISENSEKLGNECVEVLISLVFLGADQTSELIHRLLFCTRQKLPSMDWPQIATASCIYQHLESRDFITRRMVIQQIGERQQKDEEEGRVLSPLMVASQATALANTQMNNKVVANINKYLAQEEYLAQPAHMVQYARMGRRYFRITKDREASSQIREILEKVGDSFLHLIPEVQAVGIGMILPSLIITGSSAWILKQKVGDHGQKLLQQNARFRDVVDLTEACFFSGAWEKQLLSALGKCLTEQDVDIRTITDLRHFMTSRGAQRKSAHMIYQDAIVKSADKLFEHRNECNRILYYLVVHPFHDTQNRTDFFNVLWRAQDEHYGTNTILYYTYLAAFWFSNFQLVLPDSLLHNVVTILPQAPLSSLKVLSTSFPKLASKRSPSLVVQLAYIESTMQRNMAARLNNVNDIQDCFTISSIVQACTTFNDQQLIKKLFRSFLKFSAEMTPNHLDYISKALHRYSYYSPQLFDNMVDYIIENQDKVDRKRCANILGVCAHAGYQPKQMAKFEGVLTKAVKDFKRAKAPDEVLSVLTNMAVLQRFPQKELAQSMTIEFIQDLHSRLEGKSTKRHTEYMIQTLMRLNRMVVIDCPQLNAPWFFEDYCAEKYGKKAEVKKETSFRRELREALTTLVGSPKLLSECVYSRYWYDLDFEIVRDSQGNTVDISTLSPEEVRRCQRVAILALDKENFCYNTPHLKGEARVKKRHLETMGYHVVLVPLAVWNSFGLAQMSSKLDFLSSNIYK